ncbi:MAG: penicillin-binding protein 2 [Anaerolineae bacterium]|nr:MAG: penicillin-binding protein 2 [Anaerolineae bacterium]
MAASTYTWPKYRLLLLAAEMVGFGLILTWQLVRWQVIERDRFVDIVINRPTGHGETPPRRGRILDRQGHPLAVDTIEYQITATPEWIQQTENITGVANRLAPVLNLPAEEVLAQLASDAPWVLLRHHVSKETGEAIREWNTFGLHVSPLPRRGYPEGILAAHLLGFVAEPEPQDGQAFQGFQGFRGFSGVEGYYDWLLASPTRLGAGHGEATDTQASFVATGAFPFDPAEIKAEGRPDLLLTIVRMIQHIAEQELEAAIGQHQADGGTVLVMDPHNGAILAMASRPAYDPERYIEASPPQRLTNPATTWDYEPGSEFKIVTEAAALDSGLVSLDRVFEDKGVIEVGGQQMYNSDRLAHGSVTITEAMVLSLNTVMAQISTELESKRFYAYIQRFGFGRRTGVDLAGESEGQLKLPTDAMWHESDLGTNAFGQGLAVTPLQMACAAAAIANRGTMMSPYVLAEVASAGQTWPRHPTDARQVMTPKAAGQLTAILIQAAEEGAPKSVVPGYTIAGKSGTAQIPIPGGYDPQATIASFVGFAPAHDPRFVILVKVDRPRDTPWGAAVAAPIFRNIAQRLLVMMDIPPDRE